MQNTKRIVILILCYLIVLLCLMLYDHESLIRSRYNLLLQFLCFVASIFYLYSLKKENKYFSVRKSFLALLALNIAFSVLSSLMDIYIVRFHDQNALAQLTEEDIKQNNEELAQMGATNGETVEQAELRVAQKYTLRGAAIKLCWIIPFAALFNLGLAAIFSSVSSKME